MRSSVLPSIDGECVANRSHVHWEPNNRTRERVVRASLDRANARTENVRIREANCKKILMELSVLVLTNARRAIAVKRNFVDGLCDSFVFSCLRRNELLRFLSRAPFFKLHLPFWCTLLPSAGGTEWIQFMGAIQKLNDKQLRLRLYRAVSGSGGRRAIAAHASNERER